MDLLKNPSLLSFATSLADEARIISLTFFRKRTISNNKLDGTPVTEVDIAIESKLRSMIAESFPDHNIYGEEEEFLKKESEWTWVIDPIDGTKSFISGQPTFGCLIALLHLNKPVLGIIDMPALNERWVGKIGEATQHNGIECKTTNIYSLKECILSATSPDIFDSHEWASFSKLSNAVRFRLFGNDCYSYGMLSLGFIHFVMEANLGIYDYMSMIPIIIGAGGIISDWQGNELTFNSGQQVLASANASIHSQALELINNS